MRGRISVSAWVYIAALVCAAPATYGTIAAHRAVRIRAALSDRLAQTRLLAAAPSPEANSDLAGGRQLNGRQLYPYSVIPGGVESGRELQDAVLRDAVVAAHYADFNIAQAHVVRLDADRARYVSYRLGDRVFWTSKTLTLHKGETLISDGAHEARTRCGNRLSETPVAPVSPQQPPENVLLAPEAPVLFTGNFPSFPPFPGLPLSPPGEVPPAPPGTPSGGIIPPPVFPIVGGGPPPRHSSTPPPPPPPPPPVNVPEPGTLGLLAAGLLTLLAAGARVSIRKKRRA